MASEKGAESFTTDSSDLSRRTDLILLSGTASPQSTSEFAKSKESLPLPLSTDDFSDSAKVFARRPKRDPAGIATQPAVFDEPNGMELFGPPPSYENAHKFDPDFRWTWREDAKVVRKIDLKILSVVLLMNFCLELDRSNIQQANSTGFLQSIGLTTNDYNNGNSIFRLSFLAAELPSQLISKWIGPDRWLPSQLTLWSIVSLSQYWLSGRSSFLATRALLGVLQGGFIPDTILELSYFYTNSELPLRLAIFWTVQYFADIVSAFLAIPLLKIGAPNEGWRYLFLIEGCFTLAVGITSFFLMPASVTQTKTRFRPNGYFTDHEERIIVCKILRDSPTKSNMHNRQRLTFKMLWDAMLDYHLYPIYVIGILFPIPSGPVTNYLTLILKSLGFTTTLTNVLTVPSYCLNIVWLLLITWASERYKRRSLMASTEVLWCGILLIPLLIFGVSTNEWAKYVVTMLIVGHPYSHAIQVAWVSRNANGVAARTVSAALYNMTVQASAVIYAQIYRADDAPLYHEGNTVLLIIAWVAFVWYGLTWLYYTEINKRRESEWRTMSGEQKERYLRTTTDRGSRRLDFRFST